MRSKKITLVLISLVGLAISMGASYVGVLLPSHSSAGEPINVANVSALLQKLIGIKGQSDVWKLWARKSVGEGGQEYLRGGIAFRPFASSAELCRSYVIEVKSPSPWVYGHDVSAGRGKGSYDISSGLRMAIKWNGGKCSSIEFLKYFRVDREMTDQQAIQFLGYVKAVLKDWNAHKNTVQKVSVSLDQLRRINVLEKNGKPVAEFDFEVDGVGIRTFDVNLPVVGKPGYSTSLAIP